MGLDFQFQPGPLGDDPNVPEPTLAQRLDRAAMWYLGFPNIPDALWMGKQLKRLADRARFLGAASGADYDDREAEWQRAELEAIAKRRAPQPEPEVDPELFDFLAPNTG